MRQALWRSVGFRAYYPFLKRSLLSITKTRLYNFDPLKPNFYMVKRGLQGYTFFLILQKKKKKKKKKKKIDCGFTLEPPRRCGSNEYPHSMFWAEKWKLSVFFSERFPFLVVKLSIYLRCFRIANEGTVRKESKLFPFKCRRGSSNCQLQLMRLIFQYRYVPIQETEQRRYLRSLQEFVSLSNVQISDAKESIHIRVFSVWPALCWLQFHGKICLILFLPLSKKVSVLKGKNLLLLLKSVCS